MLDALDFVELARTPGAIALTLVLTVVYPLSSWLRYRSLDRDPKPWPRSRKLRVYAATILVQWVLVLAAALLLRSAGGGLADIGQRLVLTPGALFVTALLLVWFGVLVVTTRRQLAAMKADEVPEHLRRAGKLMPSDQVEAIGYAGLAVTAGICEEILYRGWVAMVFTAWLGEDIHGVVWSAVVFGLAHAYQGPVGIVMSGVLGLLFGLIVMWTGSLVPGQLVHVGIDLANGFAIVAALKRMRSAEAA